MNQTQLLNALCEWLNNHNIKWYEPNTKADGSDWMPEGVRLVTKYKKIAVCVVSPDKEGLVFHAVSKTHHRAFFVRDTETEDFLIGKMRNCLKGLTVAQANAPKPKPKRQRIRVPHKPVYERVVR